MSAPVGNLLVLAGAGSGKTRVLVHRIAWLVSQERASPHSILAVTFTNKAAGEMRGRVRQLLPGDRSRMWVGTFHGIAHRLLRMHWRAAGLPENFQIIDADDQLRLVRRVLRELDIDESQWPARRLCDYINGQKEEGVRPRMLTPDEHDRVGRLRKRVYERYEVACKQGGAVDFAELLLRCKELFQDSGNGLLQHYQERFAHLLVDEFQDTNTIQYDLISLLCGGRRNVMAVGDDDQSIYGWRGAKVENIQSFIEEFEGTELIRMEQNYRSSATILDAANGLIEHNHERLGKDLWTEADAGSRIALYTAWNEIAEGEFIAARTQQWLDEGGRPDDVAVLYRTNAQSRALEEGFLSAEIPYRIYGGLRFFERAEVKNGLAYMRLLPQPDADVAFERIVNTPPRGIGTKTLDTVRTLALEQGIPLWRATQETLQNGQLQGRAAKAMGAFVQLIEYMREAAGSGSLERVARVCIEKSGLLVHHGKGKERDERARARRENLEELVATAHRFETGGASLIEPDDGQEYAADQAVIDAFLDQAALEAGERQEQTGPAV